MRARLRASEGRKPSKRRPLSYIPTMKSFLSFVLSILNGLGYRRYCNHLEEKSFSLKQGPRKNRLDSTKGTRYNRVNSFGSSLFAWANNRLSTIKNPFKIKNKYSNKK